LLSPGAKTGQKNVVLSLQQGIEPWSPALVGMTSRNTNHYTTEEVAAKQDRSDDLMEKTQI
jgi:hypothetical protein